VLNSFPAFPALAVGRGRFRDSNLEKEVPKADVPCASLGKERALGLRQALVPFQRFVGEEEVGGVFAS
jgi:hypothetical protein